MKGILYVFLKGVCMGVADVVPGVSGGTIALIMGIYEELILTIKGINLKVIKLLFYGKWKSFFNALNLTFLAPLLLGIGTAIITFIPVMNYLLENYKPYIWSFFFGLIVASLWSIVKRVEHRTIKSFIPFLLGIIIGFCITIFPAMQMGNSNISFFFAGVLGICAMILPGISGAFILLIIGKYSQVIYAVKTFDYPVLILFALGCVVGILSFSRVVAYFFRNYKNQTLLFMAGIMLGSLNKVWPFKVTVTTYTNRHGIVKPLIENNIWIDSIHNMSLLYGCLGLCLASLFFVLIIEKMTSKL